MTIEEISPPLWFFSFLLVPGNYPVTFLFPVCLFTFRVSQSVKVHLKTLPTKNHFLVLNPPPSFPLFLPPPITQRPLLDPGQDPFLVLFLLTLSILPPFDLPFLLFVISPPSFPIHHSHPPVLFSLSPSPSLPPSLCPLSPVIPGSVSASRLSALKLSQRRSVTGRNPALRGNYLPHRLQWHINTGWYCIPQTCTHVYTHTHARTHTHTHIHTHTHRYPFNRR